MTDEFDKTIPPQRAAGNMFDMDKTMPGYRDRQTDGRFAVGDLIMGRYKVLAELGQGGMGVVYKCFDETAGIEVALKALPPELSHNSLEMDDIKDNFQLVHNLHHPNIASSNNLERNPGNGNYYLIMECCEGEDLRRWIKRKRKDNPLTLDDVLPVIRQVPDALHYAHAQKIIHRDIKPGNIMIDSAGSVKVLDFGLAAQIHTSMSRVSMAYRGTSGTGPYMAPEQWEGRVQDAAADQYALAVMTYEMLAGHLPFESADPAVLREAVLKSKAAPLDNIPESAQKALDRAMSKDLAERFNSCADFAAALGGAKVAKAKKVSSGKSGSAWKWIAAVIVLALIAAGAFFALNRTSTTPTVPVPADTAAAADGRKAEEKALVEKKAAEEKVREAEWRGLKLSDDKKTVTGVKDKDITSCVIPYGITSIGNHAFKGCTSLESITIPDSVTSIGEEAFSGCTSLRSITIPDSVISIGKRAFYGCTSLRSITIPDSVTSIGELAFYDCTSLESIMIPDSVTSIGYGVFWGCENFRSITIPDSVTSIGERAFSGCTSLTRITLGNSVTSIGVYAFSNCTSLTSITIPNSVTSIGNSAFSNCTSLTRITLGNSVTSIGENAFRFCTSLTGITIPDSVTSIGDGAFTRCSKFTSITIPDSVTSIGDRAFRGCISLTSITIPWYFTDADVNEWDVPSRCKIIR